MASYVFHNTEASLSSVAMFDALYEFNLRVKSVDVPQCICGLFNDAVSVSTCTAWNDRLVNNGIG
jgi:hypothetical protein